jgi:flagellar assembly protein FliH
MDAVIRSARVATARTRLRAEQAAEQRAPAPSAQDVWRSEVEKRVREELTVETRKLYEAERERGYADGHAAGLSDGRSDAVQEVEQIRQRLSGRIDSTVSAMEQAQRAALAQLQGSVGEVAFAAVCRLLGSKASSQSLVLQVVEHACAQLRMELGMTIRLNPRDLHEVSELLRDDARFRAIGLKLIADDSLQLGGCIVEGPSGQYDGGLESQLRRLHAVLTAAVPDATAAGESARGPGG